jgi:hypothetical protein
MTSKEKKQKPTSPQAIELAISTTLSRLCCELLLPRHHAIDIIDAALGAARRRCGPAIIPTTLPPLPPETYESRMVQDDLCRKEEIVEYLRRVWKPWINAELLTRAALERLDPSAEKAVQNWLRYRRLPKDVDLPIYSGTLCNRKLRKSARRAASSSATTAEARMKARHEGIDLGRSVALEGEFNIHNGKSQAAEAPLTRIEKT